MSAGDVLLIWFEGEPYAIPPSFIDRHPNGVELLLPYRNKDATEAFYESGHSRSAMKMLQEFKVAGDDVKAIEDGSYSLTEGVSSLGHGQGRLRVCPLRKIVPALRRLADEHAGPFSSVALTLTVAFAYVAAAAVVLRAKPV